MHWVVAMERTSSTVFRSGSLFSTLAALLDMGIAIVNDEQDIEFISERACNLLGIDGDPYSESCRNTLRAILRNVLEERPPGKSVTLRHTYRNDDQDGRIDLLIELHELEEESGCPGYLALFKDGQKLDRLQSDLRLAAQFRNTSRLYSSLAHNLRQPSSTIMVHLGLIKGLLSDHESDKTQRQRRSLDIIAQEVSELDHTLTMLLEELYTTENDEDAFSLPDLITNVARLIEPQARQQDVALEMRLPGRDVYLEGGRLPIKQAFMNLIVNALEAMPNGGTLHIELAADDDTARFAVRDTGSGIADNVLPHIFEMHYTTRSSNSGIGLHVAHQTVTTHGGTINVETEEGAGTTFTVQLPIAEEADA